MELTREKVLAMEAGREMDALVAEKLMGYKFVQEGSTLWKDDAPFPFLIYDEEFGYCLYEKYEDGWPFTMFNPSTDISTAWEVVEQITGDKWMLHSLCHRLDQHSKLDGYECCFFERWEGLDRTVRAETAPLAICRAALLTTLTE